MARTMAGRTKGSGYLEKRGDIWLARWQVNGKVFTRSTGEKVSGGKKAKDAALKKLAEFTSGYTLQNEKRILETQIARLAGVDKEIKEQDAQKPALRFMEAWSVYRASQSRPRSGEATMREYENQYFMFVNWIKQHHPETTELREVTQATANEYAQTLLEGTSKTDIEKINNARQWLYRFDYKMKIRKTPVELSEEEKRAIEARRQIAAWDIRKPVRGGTFNKHLNALALIWRHVARDERARITLNPWTFNKDTGEGIRRITLNHAERPHSRRALTVEEVYNLLKVSTGEIRALVAIGFYTGLRLGDAATLRWESIDRVTQTITVRSRKTDTLTKAAVHPALAKILQSETTPKTGGYVLPEIAELYNSGNAGRVKICSRLRDLFSAVGIQTKHSEGDGKRARIDCGFHSLRHTFVTALRDGGATLQAAQQLAGHNTARMTEHYTHEDGRAALLLPDITAEADARESTPPTVAATEADAQPPREASDAKITVADLRNALAQLSAEERAELLSGLEKQ